MSLIEIRNVVLLFSNVWHGAPVPQTVIRNITALSSQLAYEETVTNNLTTLTTTNAETTNGVLKGLLYVPTIASGHPCEGLERQYLPDNVTRADDLPPGRLKLIAIAPWFNATCTQAYLEAAREDPIRGFMFYRPNNSTDKPQSVDSPVWNLDDGGAWRKENPFPIFALPGEVGGEMMRELGRYSGDVAEVPHGAAITQLYQPGARDYVRIFTELSVETPSDLPAMWRYFLIVVLVLLFVVVVVVAVVQAMNWSKRRQLQRRVQAGEVDLEAMGIKRVPVPEWWVDQFPVFIYQEVGTTVNSIPSDTIYEAAPEYSVGAFTPNTTPNPASRTNQTPNQTPDTMPNASNPMLDISNPTPDISNPTPGISNPTLDISDSTNPTHTTHATTPISSTGSTLPRGKDPRRPGQGRAPPGWFDKYIVLGTNNQPDCHICLEAFEPSVSVVRQLPCGHIFHKECIDDVLVKTTSLCTLCKQCMLPPNYSPKITNSMVRKERNIRQLRSKVRVEGGADDGWTMRRWWGQKEDVELEDMGESIWKRPRRWRLRWAREDNE